MSETLDNHTLVLNRSWTVIGTITVKDAIILMSRNSAKGVCTQTFTTYEWDAWISGENPPQTDSRIKTPSIEIPAPQVIVLTNYNDIHQSTIKFSQRALYKRDNYRCQYCHKKFKSNELSVDHVIPRSRDGGTSWENCVTACFSCNNKKGNQSLEEAGLTLIEKPSKPRWNPVFHVAEENRPSAWKPLLKRDW